MEDLALYAINQAEGLGIDYAEIRIEKSKNKAIVLKNGNLEASELTFKLGAAVRVIANGALGFSSTNFLDKKHIKEAIETAASMAKASSKFLKKRINLAKAKPANEKYQVNQRIKLESIDFTEKLSLLFDVDKHMDSLDRSVKFPTRLFTLYEVESEKLFMNNEGSKIYSLIPRISFYYVLSAYESSKGVTQRINQIGGSGGWEIVKDWNLINLIKNEAITLAKILEKAKKVPSKKLDLIVGSELVGIISHESCGHPFEADRILGREAAQAGESFIKANMVGKRIGSEKVTIVDDPTLQNSFGYYLYDDEGVKAERRVLIENGIVKNFLHNRETANEFKTESNASARAAGYEYEPIIRMANTFMLPGNYEFEELVEDIAEGIYIKSFVEWNIDDKRFNQRYVGLEAYVIENGKLSDMAKNPIIEITTPSLYMSIDAVGKELSFNAAICGKGEPMQGVPVWTGGPEIRLRNIKVY
ncbi:MAG: TldD/PmbA family protein [Candidatus Bathyarchaeia archaeon]